MKKHKEYSFLTDVLKAQKIPFRWDEIEGLITMWKQKKVRLNSVEKAKLFLGGLKSDLAKENDEGGGGEGV